MRKRSLLLLMTLALAARTTCGAQFEDPVQPRVVELTAGKDSRYRQGGKIAPTIEVSVGEHFILRITAFRAKQTARDGSIHGIALLDKDENAVPGWRFYLHPGVQDLAVSAPDRPGRYTAVCTVICSDAHDDMGFTLLVNKPNSIAKDTQ